VHCPGFAGFELCPALLGGLPRVHARGELGFFEKIAPALVTVFRSLLFFETAHGYGRVFLASDDFNYPARYVGSHIVTDDCVGSPGFVTCQIYPV
jgi:hypothetical protein